MYKTQLAGAALLAALVLSGCGGSDASDGINLPFTTVESSTFSGVAAAETVVARSAQEFAQLWSRHSGYRIPAPAAPTVDFATMQVAGVFLGSRSSGCYSVAITRVTQTEARIEVAYREQTPAPGAACTAVITAPAHLVAFPRSPLPVVFSAQ